MTWSARLKAFALLAVCSMSMSSVNASVIYTFDVSDVSWVSNGVTGDFSASNFYFEFTDGADLNALNNSDLLSMGFNASFGSASFSGSQIGKSNINDLFGISGAVASLTVGGPGSAALWCSNNCGGNGMQVGQGGNVSLIHAVSGTNARAHSFSVSHTYYSSSVPEPSTYLLLSLGIALLLISNKALLHRKVRPQLVPVYAS